MTATGCVLSGSVSTSVLPLVTIRADVTHAMPAAWAESEGKLGWGWGLKPQGSDSRGDRASLAGACYNKPIALLFITESGAPKPELEP